MSILHPIVPCRHITASEYLPPSQGHHVPNETLKAVRLFYERCIQASKSETGPLGDLRSPQCREQMANLVINFVWCGRSMSNFFSQNLTVTFPHPMSGDAGGFGTEVQ